MILELATIDVNDSKGFEIAIEKASKVISLSKGFVSIDVKKCIEKENRFILLITWETLEDHTVGFRESELFKEWRTLIGPYFENPPLVQHYLDC